MEAAQHGLALTSWARRPPDVPAVVSELGDRTSAELNARTNPLVRARRQRGIATGDAVALLCPNRPEFADVVAGTQRGGLRLTPVVTIGAARDDRAPGR